MGAVLPFSCDRHTLREKLVRTISVKLPDDLDQELTRLARQRGASRSAVLREALERFARGISDSFAARAGDLAGSIEGPSDLSTAHDHMADYGQ